MTTPQSITDLRHLHLVLLFTEGVSLATWERGGLFDREVALYRSLRPHLGRVTFVTYGDRHDLNLAHRIEGIGIVCNRWRLAKKWYLRTLPLALRSCRRGPTIFKTNQIRGGEVALKLARRMGQPCIVRCGYLLSDHLKWREGPDAEATQKATALERTLFSQADHGIVSAGFMKRMVVTDHAIDPGRISVMHNYVDTRLFFPNPACTPHPRRIIFIGRLERVKNTLALIEALEGLDLELWIVGDGTERKTLENASQTRKVATRFFGIRPHHELPELLNSATAFILPSFWEGHPKTLLEALSCGLPCIGSDIPSIADVITHGENGLLCGLAPPSIRQAVTTLLEDPEMRTRLGENARAYALQHLSLESIVARELDLYRTLLSRPSR
ncbi:MAG: glycosyltransferase family 4 protein [Magnetococcales bacterium]|nr:glycosyltransferase family 4 protein [Magnetococcales bacterium]